MNQQNTGRDDERDKDKDQNKDKGEGEAERGREGDGRPTHRPPGDGPNPTGIVESPGKSGEEHP